MISSIIITLIAFPCHDGMAHPLVADGETLQVWRVAISILKKAADKMLSYSLRDGWWFKKISPYKSAM
jgi:hypothetical protein